MNKKKIIALCAGVVGVIAIAYAGYSSLHNRQSTTGAGDALNNAGQQLRVTLDPKRFQGDVRQAYEVAERDPALLAQMHCYCGCDHQEGHKNLLDCFRDDHGSKCAICVGEAHDADAMAARGVPVDQIRDTLRARYAGG
ncbi:MAG: CYCXC family (seleno)protein [Candidatus Binatus sp.]|uniref:CYCXC family (seleno)protein n=1 Tax=Candidatus Binatus sp. TaxID=2811406 RepID=UPI00271744D4|nr:CYCXC family (seleno)protein [Candidatus Binatus sp.]MDO8433909.1 CYCXC family (seleno)protein [Candidatus Binatus sp.]